MRRLAAIALAPLPWPLKRLGGRLLGWQIGRGAKVGFALVDAQEVVLGEGARIGHLTSIRRVRRLELGPRAGIGSRVEVAGPPADLPRGAIPADWTGTLVLGTGAQIVSRHFIDLAGTVTLGPWATLAGRDSHVWTHEPELRDGERLPTVRSVSLGERCYVGACVTLLPGAMLAAGVLVGAGSVVTRAASAAPEAAVLAGNPAREVARTAGLELDGV